MKVRANKPIGIRVEKPPTNLKNFDKLFQKKTPKNLSALDEFYRNTVSHLSGAARRQYCTNLIGRLEQDLKLSKCKKEIAHIKQNIRAALHEIKLLKDVQ